MLYFYLPEVFTSKIFFQPLIVDKTGYFESHYSNFNSLQLFCNRPIDDNFKNTLCKIQQIIQLLKYICFVY